MAAQKDLEDLRAEQRVGSQWIVEWAKEASSALVPLGTSPILVVERPAKIVNIFPVLDSIADRLRRLDRTLGTHIESKGRELCHMVAEHVLTCFWSHDPFHA